MARGGEIQKMNRLISKSTGEDINTDLLAVISARENDRAAALALAPLNQITAKGLKQQHITAAPISQTTLSQTNTFNGKCLVLALCCGAVDFSSAVAQRLSRGV